MILFGQQMKAMRVILPTAHKNGGDERHYSWVEVDTGKSTVRFTDGFNMIVFKDGRFDDTSGETEMQKRMHGFVDKIYIPMVEFLSLPDISSIVVRRCVDENKNEVLLTYLYAQDPLNYKITDQAIIGERDFDIDMESIEKRSMDRGLFDIAFAPKLHYSSAKVNFDKILKVFGGGDYDISPEITRHQGAYLEIEHIVSCKTPVSL